MASVGDVTVKVIPDLSEIEPLVRAEMERAVAAAGKTLGEVDRDEIADMLINAGLTRGVHPCVLADRLRERFLILERNASKP